MKSPMYRVLEHKDEYADETYVMIGLQGSQNYGLATEFSDVDTKMLVVPKLGDIVRNEKPVSTTKVLDNDEHCDVKDIRVYWNSLRKQNVNFVELLFTKWYHVNPLYAAPWATLLDNREAIARYDTHRAVKCIYGMALEKLHALDHPYPAKAAVLAEFGYDPKQLHHILRLHRFMNDYLADKSYEECLLPDKEFCEYLVKVKLNGNGLNLSDARDTAEAVVSSMKARVDYYVETVPAQVDSSVDELLDNVLEDIVTIALKKELK